MGWLWSSDTTREDGATTAANEQAPQTSRFALTDEQRLRFFGKPSTPTTSSQSNEQQADAELDAFIKSFSSEESATEAARDLADPRTTRQKGTQRVPTNHDRIRADGSLDISPEVIYPRTMSCRQAFDQAFYCQSLGGKFNDIYRYGHLRSCSEQWGAFWFCMRTRTLQDDARQEAIREHYASRAERKKQEFGSSEDVWEIRHTAVQKAFWKDPDAEEG